MNNCYHELSVQTLPVQTQDIKVTGKQKGETKKQYFAEAKVFLKEGSACQGSAHIHSKGGKSGSDGYFGQQKFAQKVRKSRQN